MTEIEDSMKTLMVQVQAEFSRLTGMTMVQVPIAVVQALEDAGLIYRNNAGAAVLGIEAEKN